MSTHQFRAADRLLRSTARRGSGWWVLVVLTAAAELGVALLLPHALAGVIDDVLAGREPLLAVARLAALLAAQAAACLVATLAAAYLTARVTSGLRHRLLGRVLVGGPSRGSAGEPAGFGAGNLTARLIGDTTMVGAFGPMAVSGVASVASALGGVVALWLLDWPLGVAVVLGLGASALVVRILARDVSGLFLRYSATLGEIADRLGATFAGVRTIRSAGTAGQEIRRVLAPLPELSDAGRQVWDAQRHATLRLGIAGPVITVAILVLAGFAVAHGRISPGQFVAAAGYAALALGLTDQVDVLLALVRVRTSAARISEVLDAPFAPSGHRRLTPGPGALELRGVSVRGALSGLDLRVPPGRAVALVGAAGSGVPVLALLAGGLRAPDAGELALDGMPLTDLAPEELPRAVATAFARPALLGRTVADAIRYARPELPLGEVRAAARTAHADDFVRRLPLGYRTPLADAPMSGGEAQRLGLARAIATGARLTVFDDATSSLDTATEALVGEAVTTALSGRTRLVVTHRAATAARADLVAWLDGGRLRALAPHAALWRDPEYRAVFAGNQEEWAA